MNNHHYENIEIWKDIEGYEGLYCVSNFGRVKSLSRIIFNKRGFSFKSKEKILKDAKVPKRYCLVGLFKDKKHYTYPVHRLVAQSFIPNFENKPQVNHKNGNKWDNKIDNLEWVSCLENHLHSVRIGKTIYRGRMDIGESVKGLKGLKSIRSSKPIFQLDYKTNKEINFWGSMRLASFSLKIDQSSLWRAIYKSRRSRSAGGFKWRLATPEEIILHKNDKNAY